MNAEVCDKTVVMQQYSSYRALGGNATNSNNQYINLWLPALI